MSEINREWQAVTSIKRDHKGRAGWQFQAECGYERKFLDEYFTDAYGAAVYALENHQCPVSRTQRPRRLIPA